MNTGHKFKIANSMNYQFTHQTGEKSTKPSMTIPDQTMSIREILDRYARGLPIEAGKVPIYDGEDYTPDPRYMDLADRQEYMEYAKDQIKSYQETNTEKQNEVKTDQKSDAPAE